MEVSLSPEMERLVHEKVESGEFSSASEMIEVALSLLTEEEQEYRQKVEALQKEIQQGIDDLDAGRWSPADEVFARLRASRGC